MVRLTFVLLLFTSCHSLCAADKLIRHFDIRIAGFKIGELTATKTIVNDSVVNYHLVSRVSFWLFYRVEVSYSNLSSFVNGQLVDSVVKTVTNKGNYQSSSTWNKDHYKIEVDTYDYKKDTAFATPIRFNVAKLFFEPPGEKTEVYADNYGIFGDTEYMKNKYYVVDVLGNRNKYYYKDGVFDKASMDSPVKNYEIRSIE